MLICECGEIIKSGTFRDYIRTSAGPSTSTIGHNKCGHIFNFIDGNIFKKYSSKCELKSQAIKFAEKNNIENEAIGRFLVEVDRLKSCGKLPDSEILIKAFLKIVK